VAVNAGDFDYYRYKIGPADAVDCRDLRGYGEPLRPSDQPVIDDPFPLSEGPFFLCIIGGPARAYDESWQQLDFATASYVTIDRTPPLIPPQFTVEKSDRGFFVRWFYSPPEIGSYLFKYGRVGETRCEDPSSYRMALIPFLNIDNSGYPQLLCVVAEDAAGNSGPPAEYLLQ